MDFKKLNIYKILQVILILKYKILILKLILMVMHKFNILKILIQILIHKFMILINNLVLIINKYYY